VDVIEHACGPGLPSPWATGNDRDIVVKAEKRESVVNATPLEIQLLSG